LAYTQKQVEKFNRQKYIGDLEKISKNLFRMFRDEAVDVEVFKTKFSQLKKKCDEKKNIQLDSEYHHQLRAYIERLFHQTCENDTFGNEALRDIREAEMSNLNRLQKLKNGTSYRKEKHKLKHKNEDWG
jgi:hypothetical protein